MFLKCVEAEKEYNKDKSDENKKVLDDLSIEAAQKKIKLDELLNFFGMKKLSDKRIGNQL